MIYPTQMNLISLMLHKEKGNLNMSQEKCGSPTAVLYIHAHVYAGGTF